MILFENSLDSHTEAIMLFASVVEYSVVVEIQNIFLVHLQENVLYH